MLICSVCRSQNMDTAKFCGNCGNPFTQSSTSIPATPSYTTSTAAAAATSSLINCPQGHIYSSVYQNCPYCPHADSGPMSEFATRIEEPSAPITAIDGPANDFATRTGSEDTLFELPSVPPDPMQTAATVQSPVLAPTEVIPAVSPNEPVRDRFSAELKRPARPEAQERAPFVAASQPPPPEPPHAEAPAWNARPAAPESVVADPPRNPSRVPIDMEPERRTIVVAEPGQPLHGSKGRIVGWLITYSHNPDGEDFRVYAGYNRIGANPVCDIQLGDDTVSGSHAIIVYRDGRCLIKDDLSRNGTFVNGREIGEAYPLQSYDQVRIGNTYLTFIAAQRIA
ncbi:MAG: FHA domain-containing protein [Blastocatellia bacterium]